MGAFIKETGTTPRPRWEGPVVPYVLSTNLTSQMVKAIGQAIAAWESNTNIRFVQRDNETDFVEFQTGQDACNSHVGRLAANS